MYKALSPGVIQVRPTNLAEALADARKGGFQGLEFNVREVADLVDAHGADHVISLFDEAGVRPAAWGLGFDWRGTTEAWEEGVAALPRLAAAAQAIGGMRTYTWIWPGSDERAYEENWCYHVERLGPIPRILADHGVRF